MDALPLAGRRALEGKRVLVTRAIHQAGKLSEGLRALGAEPIEVPVLEIRPPESYAPLDEAIRYLDRYDWVIFTSWNTIPFIQVRAMDLGIPLPECKPRVAAIGSATAQAVEKLLHWEVSLTPREYVAESLVEELLRCWQEVSGHDFSRAEGAQEGPGALAPEQSLVGLRFLIARPEIARDVIPNALRAAGAQVDVVDAYRNVMPQAAPALLREALQQPIDAATFTSSSSVTHLAEAARAAGIAFPFAGVPAISIGPITSKTLRELGWEPAIEAKPHDVPGLVTAAAHLLGA